MPDPTGDLSVSIELNRQNDYYAPGDIVQVSATFSAAKEISVRTCKATLVLKERYQPWSDMVHTDQNTETLVSLLPSIVGLAIVAVDTVQTISEARQASKREHGPASKLAPWRANQYLIDEVEVFEREQFYANDPITYDFDLVIPGDAMPTYAGEIIEQSWAVKLDVDIPRASDVSEELAIHVTLAMPQEGLTVGRPIVEGGPRPPMMREMKIQLPKLDFYEGETIVGMLYLKTEQAINADRVTLELWRGESVMEGKKENMASMIEEQVLLARNVRLVRGTDYSYEFSLPVEIGGRSSYYDEVKEIVWFLKGVVAWDANDPDSMASVEVAVSLYGLPPADYD